MRESRLRTQLTIECLESREVLTAGVLDSTFGIGGQVATSVLGSTVDSARAVTYQPNGKMLVAGTAQASQQGFAALTRTNVDGSLDGTFGDNGQVLTDFGGNGGSFTPVDMTVLSDGRILVLGNNGTGLGNNIALLRYNTNGTLDTTFGIGGKAITAFPSTFSATTLELLASGKILVGGVSGTLNTGGPFAVLQFTSSGSLDLTFGTAGVSTASVGSGGRVNDLVVQTDGAIIAVGQSRALTLATIDFTLVRFGSTGTIDLAFGTGGRVRTDFAATSDFALVADLDASAKLRVFGIANGPGTTRNLAVAQYDTAANGALDPSFDGDGKLTASFDSGFGVARAVVSAGKLVLVGTKTSDVAVQRWNVNGTVDTTFNGGAVTLLDFGGIEAGQNLAVRADGAVAVVGSTSASNAGDFAVGQFLSTGVLDNAFDGDGKSTIDFQVSSLDPFDPPGGFVATQLDGKTVTAATLLRRQDLFTASGDVLLTRYNSNGTLDTSFGSGGLLTLDFGSDDHARGLALDWLGRIVVVASTGPTFNRDVAIARVLPNGTLDSSWDGDGTRIIDFGADDVPAGVAVDFFGRTTIALTSGEAFSGNGDILITRLGSTGATDNQFGDLGVTRIDFSTPELVTDESAVALTLDWVGRATVVGTTRESLFSPRDIVVAELKLNGILDPSFGDGGLVRLDLGGDDVPTAVAMDLFDRVAVATTVGEFGATDAAVIRLTKFGALDASFGLGGIATLDFGGIDTAQSIRFDLFGRILVGGNTTSTFAGPRDMVVARLTNSGSLDASYGSSGITTIDFGGDDVLAAISVDLFGRVVVGGTSFGEKGVLLAVARLTGDLC